LVLLRNPHPLNGGNSGTALITLGFLEGRPSRLMKKGPEPNGQAKRSLISKETVSLDERR
jgi:hypothetical protein